MQRLQDCAGDPPGPGQRATRPAKPRSRPRFRPRASRSRPRSTRCQGQEPDAALQARIKTFQTKQQAGAQELQRQQTQIQRNQAYISQQISAKLGPIYQQVMTAARRQPDGRDRHHACLGATLDVTNDVLAALNAALPSVQTTAPAQRRRRRPLTRR